MENKKTKAKGMVRGKGGPTDDAIRTHLPIGSYVMPADSTETAKGMMGLVANAQLPTQPSQNTMPVNVSDGEMIIPPEEAQAIGVDNLDNFKEETHTPIPMPVKDKAPELFLANGGQVNPWEWGKQYAQGPTTASPTVKGIPSLSGYGNNTTAQQAPSNPIQSRPTASQVARGMSSIGGVPVPMRMAIPVKLGMYSAGEYNKKWEKDNFEAGYNEMDATLKANKEIASQEASSRRMAEEDAMRLANMQAELNKGLPSNNSRSARYEIPASQDKDKSKSRLNEMQSQDVKKNDPDFELRRPDTPERTREQKEQLKKIIRFASVPHLGAQNGQLTANQLNILAGVDRDDQNRNQRVFETDAGNMAALQQAKIRRQDQENQNKFEKSRFDLAKQSQDNRFGLEVAKFNQQVDMAQPAINAANNLNYLRNAYANETDPEKRALIGQSMVQWGAPAPSSPNDKNNWITGSGGTTVDEQGNVINQGTTGINVMTGERVNFGMGGFGAGGLTTDGNGNKLVKGNRYKNADGTVAVFDGEKLVPVG